MNGLRRLDEIVTTNRADHPDRVALRAGARALTWAELEDRVLRAARLLQDLGLRPGDRFATIDKNNPVTLELALAASMVGVVQAVLNFRLAGPELARVLEDSGAKVAFVGADFVHLVAVGHGDLERVVDLADGPDDYETLLSHAEPAPTIVEAGPDDCVLQLYTSGTTGVPKGAMLTHRGLAAHTVAVAEAYAMGESSVNVVAMPLFHVGGICWALAGMHVAAETIVVRDPVPADLLSLIERTGATHIFLVPVLIAALAGTAQAREAMRSLRVLAYGGSQTPPVLLQRAVDVLGVPLYSVYGMTEMSGSFCVLEPDAHTDPQRTHLLASAGRPIPGNEVRVVDPHTARDADPGEPGEIWVRSAQQMAGYWRRPEDTADALTADGWLRTGDIGFVDGEGYVFLVDRVKDMLISGGENVYPAEVERVLVEHAAISDVAVIGVPHERWGETPRAYVVVAPGASLDGDEVIAFARDRLAHYKCPTSVVAIEALPRNASGKVLKRELRLAAASA